MNVLFWENLVLIALLFTNLPTVVEQWWNRPRHDIVKQGSPAAPA